MPNTKEIRGRIKSVKSVGQITKAMELVSAAKMRKAQTAATQSRPYATLSSELVNRLVSKVNPKLHPLLSKGSEQKEIKRVLVILITSDRGLAGAFNTNVINQALGLIHNVAEVFSAFAKGFGGSAEAERAGGRPPLRGQYRHLTNPFGGGVL